MDELEEIRKRKLKEMEEKLKYPDKPIDLQGENFDETVKKYPLILVDFWSEWCPPCTIIAPILEELAKELSGKVIFGKLNVDNNRETAMKFGIMSIPTLLVFKKEKLVDQITGAVPKEQILEKIKEHL
ncbi:MAG: thioredoxin [Candidatus Aenigmarchaeota archaeon]|nr:thioredoxin [Candidatus Aenigmarchaeota archaeon]